MAALGDVCAQNARKQLDQITLSSKSSIICQRTVQWWYLPSILPRPAFPLRCRDRTAVKRLERRLASVLTQGFDDCPTLRGRFRLLDCFSDLVHRSAIAEELQRKHALMVQDFSAEVAAVMQVSVRR